MSSSPRDAESIADIVRAGRFIATFIAGMTKDQFLADLRTRSAVQHQLLIIGEAVKRLSDTFRAAHGNIPWQRIVGARDHLIHGYDSVDMDLIWLAVSQQVPNLVAQLAIIETP